MKRNWDTLPWSAKTIGEKVQTVIVHAIAWPLGLGLFFWVLILVGGFVDTMTDYAEQHRYCLKYAKTFEARGACR